MRIYRMAFSYVKKHRIPSAQDRLIFPARVGNHKSFLISVRMASHIIFFKRVTGAFLFSSFHPLSTFFKQWIPLDSVVSLLIIHPLGKTLIFQCIYFGQPLTACAGHLSVFPVRNRSEIFLTSSVC